MNRPLPSIMSGFLLALVLHGVVQAAVYFWYPWPSMESAAILPDLRRLLPLLYIGLTQIPYLAPVFCWAWASGRKEFGRGIALAAALTAMLDIFALTWMFAQS